MSEFSKLGVIWTISNCAQLYLLFLYSNKWVFLLLWKVSSRVLLPNIDSVDRFCEGDISVTFGVGGFLFVVALDAQTHSHTCTHSYLDTHIYTLVVVLTLFTSWPRFSSCLMQNALMPVNNCGNWQICSTQSSKKQNAIISLHIDDDAYRWKSVSPSKLGFFSFWPNIYTDIILNFTFSFSLSFSVSRFLFIFVLKLSISTFIHHPNLYLDDTLFSKIYAFFYLFFWHESTYRYFIFILILLSL